MGIGVGLAMIGILTTLSIINSQFQIYRNKEVEKKLMYMLLLSDIGLVVFAALESNLIVLILGLLSTLICLVQIKQHYE